MVLEYLRNHSTDIALLQETWIKRGDKSIIQQINEFGYKVVRTSRQSKTNGGGLAVLFKSHIDVQKVSIETSSVFKSFEYLCCNIQLENCIVKLANIHRLPYSRKHRCTPLMFLNEFDDFMQTYITMPGKTLLCGDFNFNVSNNSERYSQRFLELLRSYDLNQNVKDITHKKGGLLDLIINEAQNSCIVENVVVDKVFDSSDHYPILFSIPYKIPIKSEKQQFLVRDLNNLNFEGFCNDLRSSDLAKPEKYNNLSADSVVQLYNDTLKNIFNKHCPVVQKVYKQTHAKSRCFNNELQTLKQNKRRSERRFRKNPSPTNYYYFKKFRNEYNWKLRTTREDYFKNTIDDSMKKMKPLYKTVNKLIGNSQNAVYPTFDSELNVANKMTEFFSNKILDIREHIQNKIIDNNLQREAELPFDGSEKLRNFSCVDMEKLLRFISEMNSKTSSLDPVPTAIVKKFLDILAPVILYIVNKSITDDDFPEVLKHAVITPILKDKDSNTQELKNYRPVSNLPFLSKLLEKVVHEEINLHLSHNNLLGKFQSGYRKHHSCETAMFKVIGDIQNITGKRNSTAFLTLDLSSAFDALDHKILLERIKVHFGIDGKALAWLKSYLDCRTFSVQIKGQKGKILALLFGVPQGSVLGPLLFIMYCKEIESIAKKYGLSIHLYADDSQLYIEISNDNLSDVKAAIESCLHDIQVWMTTNFLKINEDKTKYLIINPARHPIVNQDFDIVFDGEQLEKRLSTTILGSTFTSTLNFKPFIISKCQSCNNQLRNLRLIKNSLNVDLRFMLVNNLIMSQLDYCNSLLAACPQYLVNMLQKVMNNAVRFVFDLKKFDHISSYMKRLHLLPVKYRVLFKLCMHAYRTLNKSAPSYICDMFDCYQPTTSMVLREGYGRDQKMLVYCNPDELSNKCLFQIMLNTWNELPLNLRSVQSIDNFKEQLKTFYFRKAYNASGE